MIIETDKMYYFMTCLFVTYVISIEFAEVYYFYLLQVKNHNNACC